jgi:hypothetical protein
MKFTFLFFALFMRSTYTTLCHHLGNSQPETDDESINLKLKMLDVR